MKNIIEKIKENYYEKRIVKMLRDLADTNEFNKTGLKKPFQTENLGTIIVKKIDYNIVSHGDGIALLTENDCIYSNGEFVPLTSKALKVVYNYMKPHFESIMMDRLNKPKKYVQDIMLLDTYRK